MGAGADTETSTVGANATGAKNGNALDITSDLSITVSGSIKAASDVYLQAKNGSVTVNIFAKDLETDRLLKLIACDVSLGVRAINQRIGILIDGRDRWV